MDPSSIISALVGLGLVGFAGLALLEKLIPVIPSYAMLMLLGSIAPGWGALGATLIATVIGSALGGLVWYAVGRALGSERVEALVDRYGRYIFLKPELYRRLATSYQRNAFWATLIGQTVPTARVYLALPAGVLRLDPPTFVIATTLGSLAWNAPFLGLGFYLGGDSTQFGTVALIIFILLTAEIIIALVANHLRRRRKERDASQTGEQAP